MDTGFTMLPRDTSYSGAVRALTVHPARSRVGTAGFHSTAVVNQIRLVAHVCRWLDARGLGVEDLTVELVETFIPGRRSSYRALFSRRVLLPLMARPAASGAITTAAG